jgi:hypothetical protein
MEGILHNYPEQILFNQIILYYFFLGSKKSDDALLGINKRNVNLTFPSFRKCLADKCFRKLCIFI